MAICGNAFGKQVYCLLFDWIVARINDSIRGNASDVMPFIGLLDVFGFEIFEVNSFEQLCINFANEKLHQFFLKFVFKMEEQIYKEEAIQGAHRGSSNPAAASVCVAPACVAAVCVAA